MNRWWLRVLLLGIVLGLGLWAWRTWFPGPERAIRKKLTELAQAASVQGNEGELARVVNANKLVSYFAPELEITVDVPGHSIQTFRSRDELMKAALAARSAVGGLRVSFIDVSVEVAADRKSAMAHLTARVDLPGESVPQVQELKVGFQRVEGQWLIGLVETVRTLR